MLACCAGCYCVHNICCNTSTMVNLYKIYQHQGSWGKPKEPVRKTYLDSSAYVQVAAKIESAGPLRNEIAFNRVGRLIWEGALGEKPLWDIHAYLSILAGHIGPTARTLPDDDLWGMVGPMMATYSQNYLLQQTAGLDSKAWYTLLLNVYNYPDTVMADLVDDACQEETSWADSVQNIRKYARILEHATVQRYTFGNSHLNRADWLQADRLTQDLKQERTTPELARKQLRAAAEETWQTMRGETTGTGRQRQLRAMNVLTFTTDLLNTKIDTNDIATLLNPDGGASGEFKLMKNLGRISSMVPANCKEMLLRDIDTAVATRKTVYNSHELRSDIAWGYTVQGHSFELALELVAASTIQMIAGLRAEKLERRIRQHLDGGVLNSLIERGLSYKEIIATCDLSTELLKLDAARARNREQV